MSADTIKQIEFLSRALKAPRIRDAASRLADQARDAGCEYLRVWGPVNIAFGATGRCGQ